MMTEQFTDESIIKSRACPSTNSHCSWIEHVHFRWFYKICISSTTTKPLKFNNDVTANTHHDLTDKKCEFRCADCTIWFVSSIWRFFTCRMESYRNYNTIWNSQRTGICSSIQSMKWNLFSFRTIMQAKRHFCMKGS